MNLSQVLGTLSDLEDEIKPCNGWQKQDCYSAVKLCAIFFSQNGHCIKLGHHDILHSCQNVPVYVLDRHQISFTDAG